MKLSNAKRFQKQVRREDGKKIKRNKSWPILVDMSNLLTLNMTLSFIKLIFENCAAELRRKSTQTVLTLLKQLKVSLQFCIAA